jgi:hypothetical protein
LAYYLLSAGSFNSRARSFHCRGFAFFGTVLTATLLAAGDTCGVQYTTDNVVTDAGQVFDTSSPDKYYRVFLQFMPFTWN